MSIQEPECDMWDYKAAEAALVAHVWLRKALDLIRELAQHQPLLEEQFYLPLHKRTGVPSLDRFFMPPSGVRELGLTSFAYANSLTYLAVKEGHKDLAKDLWHRILRFYTRDFVEWHTLFTFPRIAINDKDERTFRTIWRNLLDPEESKWLFTTLAKRAASNGDLPALKAFLCDSKLRRLLVSCDSTLYEKPFDAPIWNALRCGHNDIVKFLTGETPLLLQFALDLRPKMLSKTLIKYHLTLEQIRSYFAWATRNPLRLLPRRQDYEGHLEGLELEVINDRLSRAVYSFKFFES